MKLLNNIVIICMIEMLLCNGFSARSLKRKRIETGPGHFHGMVQMGTIAEGAEDSEVDTNDNNEDDEEDQVNSDDQNDEDDDDDDDENEEEIVLNDSAEDEDSAESTPKDQEYYELYLDSGHRFHILWDVDYGKNIVLIEVHAIIEPYQWVAIGFSDYGEVSNADFCVLWWDHWHKVHFQDTWTDSEGILHMDKQQNCEILRIQRRRDKIVYMYRRQFDTCNDEEDYVLDDGTVHILYATQQGPLDTLDGISIPNSIHGFQRAQMLKPEIKLPKFPRDVKTFTVLANKAHVPNVETTYWCRVMKLPNMKTPKHIVQFEAVIQPGHETLVHHMEVYHCELKDGQKAPKYDGPCTSSNKPRELDPCKKVIAAWAMGAQPLVYPEEAGLPIGGPHYTPFVMLEVHYNNEDLRDDYVDSSGIRFYYTAKLRRHDAAVLEIGLEYTPKMAIPPQQPSFILSGHCIVECTEVSIPPSGIVLFAAQLHTHLTGKQAVARHFRGGMELQEIARDNHYSPHFQEIRVLKTPVLILPGDALVASCTYNTMDRENVTLGGFAIRDEMCVSYIHYYPKSYLEVCKSSIDTDVLNDYFHFLNEFEEQPTSPDKNVPENYESIEWTPLRSEMLRELYDVTPLSMQCNKSSGDRFPGYWNNMPQTRVTWALPKPPRMCSTNDDISSDSSDNQLLKRGV